MLKKSNLLFIFIVCQTLFILIAHGLYFIPTKLDVGSNPEMGNFTGLINKDKSISGSFFPYKILRNLKVGFFFKTNNF